MLPRLRLADAPSWWMVLAPKSPLSSVAIYRPVNPPHDNDALPCIPKLSIVIDQHFGVTVKKLSAFVRTAGPTRSRINTLEAWIP